MICDPGDPDYVTGATIAGAYAGGSADLPISIDRVAAATEAFTAAAGAPLFDSPAQVAEASDVVLITSCDGRAHRRHLEETLPYGRPTFVDKPMATTLADARAMAEQCAAMNVSLMACSPKRFCEAAMDLRRAFQAGEHDDVRVVEVVGPMPLEPAMPGYFWYGIHGIDVLVALLGPTCRGVRCVRDGSTDVMLCDFEGRRAIYRGLRGVHRRFHVTLHTKDGCETFDLQAGRSNHHHLLTAIVNELSRGRSPVPAEEAVAAIAIAEAANRSLEISDGIDFAT